MLVTKRKRPGRPPSRVVPDQFRRNIQIGWWWFCGATLDSIAAEFGVSRTQVARIIKNELPKYRRMGRAEFPEDPQEIEP